MWKEFGGAKAASKGSNLLTTVVLEPWPSPSPPVGLHEGDVDSGRQGSFFKKPPRPACDVQLSIFEFLGGQELDVAVPCFKRRFMACIPSL